jgi:hypothetical protein
VLERVRRLLILQRVAGSREDWDAYARWLGRIVVEQNRYGVDFKFTDGTTPSAETLAGWVKDFELEDAAAGERNVAGWIRKCEHRNHEVVEGGLSRDFATNDHDMARLARDMRRAEHRVRSLRVQRAFRRPLPVRAPSSARPRGAGRPRTRRVSRTAARSGDSGPSGSSEGDGEGEPPPPPRRPQHPEGTRALLPKRELRKWLRGRLDALDRLDVRAVVA